MLDDDDVPQVQKPSDTFFDVTWDAARRVSTELVICLDTDEDAMSTLITLGLATRKAPLDDVTALKVRARPVERGVGAPARRTKEPGMSDDTDAGELSSTPRTGAYLVVTATGSRYRIDLDNNTATRFPEPDDPDPSKNLRQDETERPLLGMGALEIGHDLMMVLDIRGDGIPTYRRTTPVISWERVA